jgi:hypothetical protein
MGLMSNNGNNGNGKHVWMWISGILLSILSALTVGVLSGSYFSRVNDSALLDQVRSERRDELYNWYEKRIDPRLATLETSNRAQIQSLEQLSVKIDRLLSKP